MPFFENDLACDNAGMPDLVKVLSVPSIMEGEIVKARLEGEGIPVLLKGGGSDPYGSSGAATPTRERSAQRGRTCTPLASTARTWSR